MIEIGSHAESWTPFVKENLPLLVVNEIELIVPLVVRDELIGLIMLSGKASGERFSSDDEVPLAARYHHERLDGRGYPENLRDREIPYIAKIVTLADFFDAMTTDPPYKRRRPASEVGADLQRNVGGQFTPEIVNAFCSAWLKELTGATKRKRILKMLGKGYCEAETIAPLLQNALNEISRTIRLTLVAN